MATDIDPHFIPAFSIEDVLLDKDTGAPLSGGLVYFYEDDQRTVKKPIYQITGTSPTYTFIQLPNPMILSSIGTFQDSMDNPVIPYFYPFTIDVNGELVPDYYFISVFNSGMVQQFTREAVPYIPIELNPDEFEESYVNELSNPQFATTYFNQSTPLVLTITAASMQVIPIAPDWNLVVSGTGTVTLSITKPAGSINVVSNPGTLLNIVSSVGISFLRLRQTLPGSPNLFGSGFLSGTFVAKTLSGSTIPMSMYYSQSNGTVTNLPVLTATLPGTNLYDQFFDNVFIPASTSSDTFPSASVFIDIAIPLQTQIEITSIQVAFTGTANTPEVMYDQESNNRQIDHLFHDYLPQLQFEPIPSYTIGWDFPFNPCQELGRAVMATALGNNKSRYIADQTISFEEVTNSLSYAFTDVGLTINTAADSQCAIIQYLDQSSARELLKNYISLMLSGSASPGTVTGTINLYYTTGILPDMNAGNSLVSSMSAGVPTVVTGWMPVKQGDGYGPSTFTLNTTGTNIPFSSFNFLGNTAATTATYFAIVIGFNTILTTQDVNILFGSLVRGQIPTPPAPLSFSETLTALSYYYQKSYNNADIPATMTSQSQVVSLQNNTINGGTISLFTIAFSHQWAVAMRTTPVMNLYSPDTGLADAVRGHVFTDNNARNEGDLSYSMNWTSFPGMNGFYALPSNATGALGVTAVSTNNPVAYVTYQYIADARLGLV